MITLGQKRERDAEAAKAHKLYPDLEVGCGAADIALAESLSAVRRRAEQLGIKIDPSPSSAQRGVPRFDPTTHQD